MDQPGRKLAVNYTRLNVTNYFCYNRVCREWNKLPGDVVNSKNVKVFRQKVLLFQVLNGN